MSHTLEGLIGRIERANRLDLVAERLAGAVGEAVSDPQVKSLLSGTWLGHPVHPMLTDVPITSFSLAALLDLLPGRWSRRPADALIATGLVATVPTALTGLNDWSDTDGETRRVGLVHALANTVASFLYLWSLVKRLRRQRLRGRLLSLVGFGTLLTGGYLGGHLSYRRAVGVNRNALDAVGPSDWRPAIALTDLPAGELTRVEVEGTDLVVYRADGSVYALAGRCSHEGGPLHEGHVNPTQRLVSCPWDQSTFHLIDGSVVRGPATAPQPAFETRIRGGIVEVRRRT